MTLDEMKRLKKEKGYTMAQLGQACRIAVGASVVAVL